MEEKIHVHKILETLIEKSSTIEELRTKFGENSRFKNCSNLDLSFDEAIGFVKAKNKVIIEGDNISFNHEIGMCNHE